MRLAWGRGRRTEKRFVFTQHSVQPRKALAVAYCGEVYEDKLVEEKKIHQGLLIIGTSLPSPEVLEPQIAGGWKVS